MSLMPNRMINVRHTAPLFSPRFARHILICAALLATALLSSCSFMLNPRSQKVSSAAVVIPNVPSQKWGVESCGAGALSTVLQHYGETTTLKQWDATLPKTRGGVLTVDMLLAARGKGFDATLVTGDRTLVERELAAQRPVILMLQVIDSPGRHYDFYHYIVADGLDPDRNLVRTQFGDGHARWVTFDKLEKSWRGGGHTAILIHPRTSDEQLTAAIRGAVVLEDAGKYDQAADEYRNLLARHPGSSLLWTNLGNAQVQLHDTEHAEESFRRAIAADPAARDAMNNLAWLLYEQKRLDEAESFARQAAAQNGPDGYVVLDTLARILAAKGDCGGASSIFRQAIEAVPAAHADARTELQRVMEETSHTCKSS
jgi:predicted negative regulator of RcsB-dependent stress response